MNSLPGWRLQVPDAGLRVELLPRVYDGRPYGVDAAKGESPLGAPGSGQGAAASTKGL